MGNYNLDRNGENLSDEHLSDQLTSDQYAEAARLASNKQGQADNKPTEAYRKVQFDQRDYQEQSNQDILQRERAFSESIEKANYQKDRLDTSPNQYSLEELDADKAKSFKDSGEYDEVKTSRSTGPRKKRTNKHLKDIGSGLQQVLTLLFSKRPMQVFHLKLHWASIGILAFINIILLAGFNTVIYSKGLDNVLASLSINASTGKVFAISLLSQFASYILLIILVIVLSILLASEKKPFKQFVQTPVLSLVPYSLILIIALITAFFLPKLGILFALSAKIHTYIYLYAGFQKGHPTRKNSPFWLFVLLIILVLFVEYLFASWALA